MRQIIDTTALDSWFVSTRRDAQEMLPHLIRRLLTETVPLNTVSGMRFLVGDQVGLPGYDGIVETTAEHPFVPQGSSVWEMGTGPADEKLYRDYRKRTDKPGKIDPAQTVFVFVTPHPVRDKQPLQDELRGEEKWRDVRILDGVDLAAWLESAPVTARWLAREMGIPVDGMLGLDEYMRQELDARYGRAIARELLISGREDPQQSLLEWLESDSREMRIEGESQEEGCAFIAAALCMLPHEKREQMDSRLVFAFDPQVLDFLGHLQTPHYLVAMTPEVRRRAEALDSPSIRILVPRMRMAGSGEPSHERCAIKLGNIHRRPCAEALRGMGFTDQESNRISRESKGSLTAVLWMIAQEHDTPLPWVNAEAALELLPVLLAGQWDAENEQDRDAVATMAGKSYGEVERVLAKWSAPDGPLVLRGTVWDWLAWDYAWVCLCPFLSHSHVSSFCSAAERVLGEPDPKLELAAKDRWAAAMHGKKHLYSTFLRSGLVGSIARFATEANAITAGAGRAIAGNLVRKLLDGKEFDRSTTWLSLSLWLPDLAEAAPDEFLQVLDRLQNDGPCVQAFFEEGGLFGSSPHVYLLWALERLAWSEELLARSTVVLGDLAALDPGGHLSNRPLNSLKEIFLPWHPHTTASPANRVAAIDALHSHHPQVAWDLAAALLPEATSFSSGTAEPQWHAWKPDGDVNVTIAEYWQFVEEMVTRMLRWAGSAGSHWKTLIESYNNLRTGHPELASQVLAALQALCPSDFNEGDTCLISDTIRSLLSTHREISDAKWAMSNDLLVPFEEMYSRFQPKDLVSKFKWLFTSWPHLPNMKDVEYEEQIKLIEEERMKATVEILGTGGIDTALSMFESLERPDTLGGSLAEVGMKRDDEIKFLHAALHLVPLPDRFPATMRAGFGYVGCKHHRYGDEWLRGIVSCADMDWDSNAFANLALGLPEEGPTWDKLAMWDTEALTLYWQRSLICHLREKKRDAPRAVSCLLEAGRPYRAIEVVGMAVGRTGRHADKASPLDVPPELIVKALQMAPRKNPSDEWFAPQMTMVMHYVETLLEALESVGVEQGVLAGIEWAWLAGLDRGRRGVPALENALATDPCLFVDILKLVFRAEGEEARELSESDSNRASQAYRLLEAWHSVPGMVETEKGTKEFEGDIVFHMGTVDEVALTKWVDRARKLAAVCGRLAICDSRIGNVLAHSPMRKDDAWPCESVRNLLDLIRSEELERGLQTGVYNKRGVHTRISGGVQELKLAEKFAGYSAKVRPHWPRAGAILARISEQFEREAKWHQEQETFEEFE